jgi:hypothetical protein
MTRMATASAILAVALSLSLGQAASLAAEEAQPAAATGATAAEEALPRLEQTAPENPLARFEIVSLGSYPITIFYVDLAFDLQRWIANGYDPAYTPIFSATTATLTDTQRLQRLGVALGVSVVIGTIDAIIHASKVKAARRLREAKISVDAEGEAPGTAP